MCGFFGIVGVSHKIRQRKFIDATNSLAHRGPDAKGFYFCDNVALGHRRLIVVDPVGGEQPMEYKNFIIVYNGELYNTEDIREKLINEGYTFDGHSDTEVLLKAYAHYKEDVVKKLNGIFSFIIHNTVDNQFFVARDRLGVKPLFYYYDEKKLVVGSEIKPLLKYLKINEVDTNGLRELLGLGPSHTPGETPYKDIYSLRPGHYLKFEKGKIAITRYWNVKSKPHTDNLEQTVKKTKEILVDSITRQLVSDVPLCTFLSGGLDSSAITAIANKGKENLHTYSIDYENNEKNFVENDFQISRDEDFIDLLVNKEKITNEKYIVNNNELKDALKRAVEFRDMPAMADIDSSLFLFCEHIKDKHTVALSGECADEIFGGYPWFYREDLQGEIFPWIRSLKERTELLKDEWRDKLQIEKYVKKRYEETIAECPTLKNETKNEKKLREMFYLNMLWFMTTLLERKDRMSMGASLEVRVPFADHRIVEYLWNVPWEMKFLNSQEKGLLRKSLEGLLPDEILYRKKNPYPKTHDPIYTNMVKQLLKEALDDETSILHILFKEDKLTKLLKSGGQSLEKPYFGQLMTGPQFLAYLYQLHYWAKTYDIKIVD